MKPQPLEGPIFFPVRRFLSAFDLDRTLLKANSSFRFCLFLVRRRHLPWSTLLYSLYYYFKHVRGQLSIKELHEKVFRRHLKGFSYTLLQHEAKLFIEKIKESDFYPPALAHFRWAKRVGHTTALLSSSPSFLVAPFAAMLGFDLSFSSEYAVNAQGRLEHILSILEGEGKAEALHRLAQERGIEKRGIIAYSDSFFDLPFLKAAGVSVAVKPDRLLKKYSNAHRWLTL